MTAGQLLNWDGARLHTSPSDPSQDDAQDDGELLVADSWLVSDGRAIGADEHRRRFLHDCHEALGPIEGLNRFWDAAIEALPRRGDCFPRFELPAGPDPTPRLRLRPAPVLRSQVRVWIPGGTDPRRRPRRKGPDLPVLARLRDQAVAVGADDALLLDADGYLIESAHSSLLWWEGDTLCLPDLTQPTLPGVTAGLIRRRARATGIPVRHVRRRPTDLDGREAWLTNALHGICPVTAWIVDGQIRPGRADRAGAWRRWHTASATRLGGTSG